MTPDKQAWIVQQLTENTAVNQMRSAFSGEAARIENAGRQRVCPTPLEVREMEFNAIAHLLILAVELKLV